MGQEIKKGLKEENYYGVWELYRFSISHEAFHDHVLCRVCAFVRTPIRMVCTYAQFCTEHHESGGEHSNALQVEHLFGIWSVEVGERGY